MGTGVLTLNGTDVTSKTDLESFEAEFQANRLNGVMDAVLKSVAVKEQDEVILTDGGVRIFGGKVAIPTPRLEGGTVWTKVKAVSFDVLLDHRVIETGARTGSRYDDDDAKWIVGFHAELLSTSFVSRLRTDVLPDIDYSGMTLRQALEHLATYTTGAAYWVDENKHLHWTDPQSAQLVENTGWDGGASTNWSLDGSASITADAGPGGTGDYALVTTGNGSGMHETTQTAATVVGNRRYLFQVDLWSSVASKAQVRLDWQNSSSVSQRVDTLTNSGATSTWNRYKAVYSAPAAAVKVVIRLGGVNNFTGTVRHDNPTIVGEDAAFGIDTSPNGSTTRAPERWRETREAVVPINRVLVIGQGISGWREHAASISYFGGKRFEGVIKDDRVTTTDGIDSRAAFVFRKYAFPGISGSYVTRVAGLKAGTWQLIRVVSADGILSVLSIVYLTTVKTRFTGASQMEYEVTYGEPEDDAGGAMASIESSFAGIVPVPGGPPANEEPPGQDTTAPATPTGLALSTGTTQQPDGALAPYLLASWNANADTDLDAYELAIDRAILGPVTFSASASGSGGSLPAGTYAVNITGNGAVAGESQAAATPQSVVVSAGQRLYVNITAKTGMASYRAYASILAGGEEQPKLTGQTAITTTGSNVEITAAGSGAYPPTSSTAVAFINPTTSRLLGLSYYTENVIGNAYYAARLRAIDVSGNESGWTAVQTVTAGKDTAAPDVPEGLSAIGGFRMAGLAWQRNSEPDLLRYQVRYTTDDPTSVDAAWTMMTVAGTSIVIGDLAPNIVHYFQARAIDRSGNTPTSEQDSTAVNADANTGAGWSNTGADTSGGFSTTLAAAASAGATNIKVTSVTNLAVGMKLRVGTTPERVTVVTVGTAGGGGTGVDITPALVAAKGNGEAVVQIVSLLVSALPDLIGAADFVAFSIIARTIDADHITADDIKAGTLTVGGTPNTPDYLLVYNNSGQEIGRWDAFGLLIKDPANPSRQMRFLNGTLSFSSDSGLSWITAIDGQGITADAIKLGAIPGGHNAIPNPGFELAAFGQGQEKVWTSSTDWGTTIGTDVNLDKSTGDLKMSSVAY